MKWLSPQWDKWREGEEFIGNIPGQDRIRIFINIETIVKQPKESEWLESDNAEGCAVYRHELSI